MSLQDVDLFTCPCFVVVVVVVVVIVVVVVFFVIPRQLRCVVVWRYLQGNGKMMISVHIMISTHQGGLIFKGN